MTSQIYMHPDIILIIMPELLIIMLYQLNGFLRYQLSCEFGMERLSRMLQVGLMQSLKVKEGDRKHTVKQVYVRRKTVVKVM